MMSGFLTVTVQHSAEMAHRLPFLPGKCQNLHGHSWQIHITVNAGLDQNGISVEYGLLKSVIRGWIDEYLDHGTALGKNDPLVKALKEDPHHEKLFVFGETQSTFELPWPTVEAMAIMIGRVIDNLFTVSEHRASMRGCEVIQVKVQETAVNSATWKKYP